MQPPFVFTLVFFSLCLELHHVRCQKICTGDKYTIVTSNDTFLRCFNCETCHPGRGLYPPCGRHILDADKSKIDCKDCPPGTFSDELDSSPCKVCQECADHEIASSNCTKVSDTICSKTCKKGYFFAKVSHNCQQCSYCCFDGKDEPQPECIKQGLNATGQYCSFRLDKDCSPHPTTIGTTLGTTVTSLPSTSYKTTKLPTDEPTNLPSHNQNTATPTVTTSTGIVPSTTNNSTTNNAMIVIGVLAGVFCVVLVIVGIIYRRKSKIWKQTGTERTQHDAEDMNTGEEDRTASRTQDNTYASEGPTQSNLRVQYENDRVQVLKNAGYVPSSPEESPCVTEDEIDELPHVTVRNKRFIKRQSSREAQASKDGANEDLLESREDDSNKTKEPDSKGGGPARSRRPSLETFKKKLSFSFEKDNYQPLAGEDPDEPEGNEGARRPSGSLSFSAALKRKLSGQSDKRDCQDPNEEDDSQSCAEPLNVLVEPAYQEKKEGSRVEFKCNIKGKKDVRYQWFKDDSKMQGQRSSTLVLKSVKMEDFGSYKCQVKYGDGYCKCVESFSAELDIVPREAMEYKCLRDVDPNIQDKVGTLLTKKIQGLGNWRQVAYKYTMDPHVIDSLEGDHTAGKEVLSFVKTTNINFKVYEFCKTLKEPEIRRFDIIRELLDHLSTPVSVSGGKA